MTGKYVKGEDKEGTEKRIIKSKRIFKKEIHSKRTTRKRNQGETYIQEREQKTENVQKTDKKKHKKENFFFKGIEKGQTCTKPTNL